MFIESNLPQYLSSGAAVTTIGVFVATRWELEAVRQAFPASEVRVIGGMRCLVARQGLIEWWIILMGVGPERAAAAATRMLAAQRFTAIWSTGFACALGAADIGDVLIGTDVIMENSAQPESRESCAPAMVDYMRQVTLAQGLPMQSGGFISVPRVLCLAEEKREIAGRIGGIGLDMESAALGAVASEHHIPFAIVRTVSDLVDESLPLDFNLFLRPSGWAKGVVSCLTHPTSLIGLNRLRVQSGIAGARLTALYRACADRAQREGIS